MRKIWLIMFIVLSSTSELALGNEPSDVSSGAAQYDWDTCINAKTSSCADNCTTSEDPDCTDNCSDEARDKCLSEGLKPSD